VHVKLTTSVIVASLAAFSPATALASTDDGPPNRIDALNHAATMRSLALLHQQLAEQTERISAPAKTAPATTARLVAADDGFHWVDGAVGAGLTATVLIAVAGANSARRRPATLAR
jgi:hypothetical protein